MKKVILVGPLLTRSGYGEQARFALRSLRSRPDLFDIYIKPINWGKTSWIVENSDERQWIDQTIEKTIGYLQQGGTFDISLQVTIPNEFQNIAHTNIGYTAGIETTQVAPEWTQKCNEMDSIIVVSNHSGRVIENAAFEGVNEATGEKILLKNEVDINVVNYPVKTFEELPDLQLDVDTDFNFLTVAQMGPRKNLENTIKWFVEEFKDENVGLIVKTNIAKNSLIDRVGCMQNLSEIVNRLGLENRKCKVFMLHGHMTDEEMHSLYAHKAVNAMLALPHGEGFGLPIFESAYSGLPVVSVGWSGQCDFLYEEREAHFYEVAFDIRKIQDHVVWEGVLSGESGWAYPREQSAKEQMRRCYEDIITQNKDCIASFSRDRADQLLEKFSKYKMYEQFVSCIVTKEEMNTIEEEVDSLLKDLI